MNRERAVDVGCGSGQSTFVLQPHFKEIIGIDVSSTQIEEAKKLLNHDSTITFKVGPGESLPFLDRSCDLVTCCQTIHWLDIPKFYSEVDRILKPGGILAVFGYHFTGPSPNVPNHKEIEKLRKELYEITQPFWDSKRALVDQGYTTIPQIPYSNSFRDESHYTDVEGTLDDFIGYITTWSGFRAFQNVQGNLEAGQLLQTFRDKCLDLLLKSADSEVEVHREDLLLSTPKVALRTNYFLLVGQKPDHPEK
ncbi:hypothetical protein TCAL_03933 [Tigriopus californicus]|uniref:Methyltransferase type 11 domain-containing protein n=1 Tax=Tigriopus californicus TaxID=6832 RepID=A0A553P2M0_TIGCA|nr:hypothetical protein TCAL_03933 [Tigriopus californicus]